VTEPLYFDFAATTPLCSAARDAMINALDHDYANYNSINHALGRDVHLHIEDARNHILESLRLAHSHYLVFTSGATESINLANQGGFRAYQRSLKGIAALATDHKVSLEVLNALSSSIATTLLPVDSGGLIDDTYFKNYLKGGPSLVNICAVNNETGVIQPIHELTQLVHQSGGIVHLDASQMIGKMPLIDLSEIDFMSISAHKFYGPKGIGALLIKKNRRIEPIFYGSRQEYGIRPGTPANHQIRGMQAALSDTLKTYMAQKDQLELEYHVIKNYFESKGAVINGKNTCHLTINIKLPHRFSRKLIEEGFASYVAFSFGSACQTTNLAPSHVLSAMGLGPDEISRSIRISLGLNMPKDSVASLLSCFESIS